MARFVVAPKQVPGRPLQVVDLDKQRPNPRNHPPPDMPCSERLGRSLLCSAGYRSVHDFCTRTGFPKRALVDGMQGRPIRQASVTAFIRLMVEAGVDMSNPLVTERVFPVIVHGSLPEGAEEVDPSADDPMWTE